MWAMDVSDLSDLIGLYLVGVPVAIGAGIALLVLRAARRRRRAEG